jgi:hypothetical protein
MYSATERSIDACDTAKKAGANPVSGVMIAVPYTAIFTIGVAMLNDAPLAAVRCSAASARVSTLRW